MIPLNITGVLGFSLGSGAEETAAAALRFHLLRLINCITRNERKLGIDTVNLDVKFLPVAMIHRTRGHPRPGPPLPSHSHIFALHADAVQVYLNRMRKKYFRLRQTDIAEQTNL